MYDVFTMKILVRMPNYVGDVLLATPVLEVLSKNYPDANIVALVKEPLGEMLEGNPYISEVWHLGKKGGRFWPVDMSGRALIPRIKNEKFHLGISLVPTFSAITMFKRGKVSKIISFSSFSTRWLLSRAAPKVDIHNGSLHAVDGYLSVLLPLGIKGKCAPKLFIEKRSHDKSTCVIGINAGASRSSKMWPKERFHAVAERLSEELPGSEIRFYGDSSMHEFMKEVCGGLPKNVVNLTGKTTLKELIAEIGGCDAFLSGDSGPMHIAASYKVPLVALFGSSNPIASSPYEWGKLINKNVDCSPCMLKDCPIDHRCMMQIEVDEVLSAVKAAILQKPLSNLATQTSFENAIPPKITVEKSNAQLDEKIGVIILAGGVGRRLGLNGPKGLVKFQGETLFERIIKKSGERVIILTSPMTDQATKEYFGPHSEVDIVTEGALPFVKGQGASPIGNGGVFAAIVDSPVWKKWEDVTRISVVPVDNPLADPLSPNMLGWKEDLVVCSVKKKRPDESLGTLIEKDGKLSICEYSELPDCERKALNSDGSYKWQYGYTGMFTFSKELFEKAAKEDLPFHKVVRSSGVWLEKFIFDAFLLSPNYRVILAERSKCFAPIKTPQDLHRS